MNDALGSIGDALNGSHGEDQKRIAETVVDWGNLLLAKNKDYGCSVWKTPILCPDMEPSAAILVRMTDKIERLQRLAAGNSPAVAESFDDTVRDLGAYCLLYLARPQE